MNAVSQSALTPTRTGWADAFTWPLAPGHFLALINPLWSGDRVQARIERVRMETADTRTLVLRLGRGWHRHRAGQHVQVSLAIDGVLRTRTYSISSAPTRGRHIQITVKAMGKGGVSEHLVRHAQVGDVLTLSPPHGDFMLPRPVPRQMLLVSGGSGITPLMAMLRRLAARSQLWDVVHVHYATEASDVIFRDELSVLQARHPGYRLHRVYTRQSGVAPGERHFSAAQLARLCPDWAERQAYACGPEALLARLDAHWADTGLSGQLNIERFHAQLATPPATAHGGAIVFQRSGVNTTADGTTPLLLVAEGTGLQPPHGCRMGICHGCDAVLLSGCVRDLRNNTVYNTPGQRVQPCVCAAAGDATLDL